MNVTNSVSYFNRSQNDARGLLYKAVNKINGIENRICLFLVECKLSGFLADIGQKIHLTISE